MKEYLNTLENWQQQHRSFALARVIRTWGSSPRPVGSCLFIDEEGHMVGSVSGGCVEGAVVQAAQEVLKHGAAKILKYGISDEDAWTVGLSCGGNVEVLLQSIVTSDRIHLPFWPALLQALQQDQPCSWVTLLEDGNPTNTLIQGDRSVSGDSLPPEVLGEARQAYQQRTHRTVEVNKQAYFVHLFPRKPQLLIVGAAHITADLVELGHLFGFRTVVIDPRGAFARKTQFQVPPDELIEAYPSEVLEDFPLDAYTFCAILSHDPKIDDNALEILLPSEVAYIGALGSRKTHAKRVQRLTEKGVSDELISRIQSPIGVDIHAKSAREIALSVMGAVVAMKNQYQ
ncbi:MAG: XdhC family protein [Cyclobacteriaceae bacterium]